jgi:RNA polymerase sigma factor (sigma-70 family)
VSDARSFEATVLPWLDAGYNLARWLLHDEAAAEDVVQEAALRALRYFESLRGNEARAWFLGIVRNACFTYLKERSGRNEQTGWEEDELEGLHYAAGFSSPDPAQTLARGRERETVNAAIRALSPPLREVIVLRELEGLEYAEIALIAVIPIGTVMSRLSRARSRLKVLLTQAGIND